MKYPKFFLMGCLMAFAMNANAQIKTTTTTETTETTIFTSDSTTVTTTRTVSKSKSYDMGYHLMPEIKIGSCYGFAGFGANLVLEHEFHPYWAWDIASLDFAAPFNFNEANFGLKTGIRFFTPRFSKDRMRGYMSLAAGYDCYIKEDVEFTKEDGRYHFKNKAHHGLGLSLGIGLQIKEHFYIGYTMEYSTAAKFTSHYGKFAYRF